MIRYALKCADGHAFDSWFQSTETFDGLMARGHVTCAICGQSDVSKALMAPNVAVSASPARKPGEATPTPPTSLSAPVHPAEAMLRAMREHVEKTSTYVGGNFAREARAMHLGDRPEQAIHGEAAPDEARALIEDGIPILPLPMLPKRKAN